MRWFNSITRKRASVLLLIFMIIAMPVSYAVQFSDIRTTDITDSNAVVRWNTDTASDSKVLYSVSKNLSSPGSAYHRFLVFNHSIGLNNLEKSTTYYYEVLSSGSSDDKIYSFTTAVNDSIPPQINPFIPRYISHPSIDIFFDTEAETEVNVYVNGRLTRTGSADNGVILFKGVSLSKGKDNSIRITAKDKAGNSNEASYMITVDMTPPEIDANLPDIINSSSIKVDGSVDEVSDIEIYVNDDLKESIENATSYSTTVDLDEGNNILKIIARNLAGLVSEFTKKVTLRSQPPKIYNVTPLDERPFYYEGKAEDRLSGYTDPGATVYLYIAGTKGSKISFGWTPFVEEGVKELSPYFEYGSQKDKPVAKVKADENGRFDFGNIDFEHPNTGIASISPKEVTSKELEISGVNAETGYKERESSIGVILVAAWEDSGIFTKKDYRINIGTCFSGFADFDINILPEFQQPDSLNPERLDAGTEIVSFIMNISYKGRAAQNINDINTKEKTDYWNVKSLRISKACKSAFIKRDKALQYACSILPSNPQLVPNSDKTTWYVRYDLGSTDAFTNFSKDFWSDILNRKLEFPLQVFVNYEEKIPDKSSRSKVQSKCVSVDYTVDTPIDPRKYLPDFMTDEVVSATNKTIDAIDKITPILDKVILIAGVGCVSSVLTRFVAKTWRRLAVKLDYAQCLIEKTKSGIKCPELKKGVLTNAYISEGGDKPPRTASDSNLINLNDKKYSSIFSSTISAWKFEKAIDYAMKFSCDRVFCKASPAKWTEDKSLNEIFNKEQEQRACANKDAAQMQPLIRVNKCSDTAEKELSDKYRRSDVCYAFGDGLYVVDNKDNSNIAVKTRGYYILDRADGNTGVITEGGYDTSNPPNRLFAVKRGNSYATALPNSCNDECSAVFDKIKVRGECITEDDAGDKNGIAKGYTKDCFAGTNGDNAIQEDKLCYCIPGKKTEEAKSSDDKYHNAKEKEKYFYREDRLYKETGSSGTKYPENRYYAGRDFPAAFGQNHIFDVIAGSEKIPKVDPFTQHIGAVQAVCLTGVRNRLQFLKNILQGYNNCMAQIKATGEANAGVCKEIFTNYVCDMAYTAYSWVRNGCVPMPFSKGLKLDGSDNRKVVDGDIGIGDFIQKGVQSIGEEVESSISDLKSDYGNAQLNQFLRGGEKGVLKNVCLAAFGFDVGWNFDTFMDLAYTAPFKTSVMDFGSRRKFLTFNPKTGISTYEYRGSYVINAGCDLEDYTVELACPSQKEITTHRDIDCSAVEDKEGSGCDCLRLDSEKTRLLESGANVDQGSYNDRQVPPTVVEDNYRYDHLKISLRLNPDDDPNKCLPEGHRDGVFYFPIRDQTAEKVEACNLDISSGKFYCGKGQLLFEQKGDAYFEDVRCLDPGTGKYLPCSRVNLEIGDRIRIKPTISVIPDKRYCLRHVLNTPAGDFPQKELEFITLTPSRSGSIEKVIDFGGTKVTEQIYTGRGAGISLGRGYSRDECDFTENIEDNVISGQKGGRVSFNFTKVNGGYTLKVGRDVKLNAASINSGYTINNEGAVSKTSSNDGILTESEIRSINFIAAGYGIGNLFRKDLGDRESKLCEFNTVASNQLSKGSRTISAQLELWYPDKQGSCIEPFQRITTTNGNTAETIPISIVQERSSRGSAKFNSAVDYYNSARSESEYIEAAGKFKDVIDESRNGYYDSLNYEIASYEYAVLSFANANSTKYKDRILEYIRSFNRRTEEEDFKDSSKYEGNLLKLVKEHLSKINGSLK